ncbi:SpvB/TcaC N-terminal domain-containing protein, partial [Vibrio cionasavignyae]|uniref:SpvB/TcaC N-terminal domain-containing protein n=1 Tax=Vibrio cionasavignyae TaxID=2910252 RepID=UPI003D128559
MDAKNNMLRQGVLGQFAKVAIGVVLALLVSHASAQSLDNATISLAGQYRTSGGQAGYTLPIEALPGRAGVQPELAFSYRSDRGNGTLGVGWQIRGLSAISRCGQNLLSDDQWGGVNFNNDDRYCLDGQRLIAVTGNDGGHHTEYRVKKNGYAKVVSYGSVEGAPDYFMVWKKDGSVFEYGKHSGAKAKLPSSDVTYQWLMNKQSDVTRNNVLDYRYTQPNGSTVPLIEEIDYVGGKLTFTYAARQDTQRVYLGGKAIIKNQRLTELTVYNSVNARVGSYQLSYKAIPMSGRSLLEKIQYCVSNHCATPITFDWQNHDKVGFSHAETTDYNAPRFYDVDGNGKDNLYGVISQNRSTGKMVIRDLAGNTHGNISALTLKGSVLSPSLGLNNCSVNAASSYSDGEGNLVTYCRFSSCGGDSCKYPSKGVNAGDFNGDGSGELINGFLVADFNGDGRDDKHRFDIPNGDYRYELSNGLSGSLSSPGGRVLKSLADINRDGYLDVFTGPATGSGHLYLHQFTGTGFAPPIKLELQINSDDDVRLADITGDGYPELVHKGKFYRNLYGAIATVQSLQRFDEGLDPNASTDITSVQELAPPILDVGNDVYAVRDINGDGWADILTRENDDAKVSIRYSVSKVQDKITRFNEFGLVYQVTYRPASDSLVHQKDDIANNTLDAFPYKQLTPARYLVAQVQKQPQGYDTTRYIYHYQGARSHLQGGGFLGFASITETEMASVITETVTEYKQDDPKLAGNPVRTQVFKVALSSPSTKQRISDVRYEYQLESYLGYQAKYYQTYANKVTKNWYSPGQEVLDKQELTTRTLDRFGNPTSEVTTFTSGHSGAGSYTRTTNLAYLSTGSNQTRFVYTLNQQAGSVVPSTLSQYSAGLTRYCADSGETYFKPNDVFVLIGSPSTPILAKRYDEYFKYRSVSLSDNTDGASEFSGDLVSVSKAQFDAANVYQCGQVSVTHPHGNQSAMLVANETSGAEIVTESPNQFWKLAAVVKETSTLHDGVSSRTIESNLQYHENGLLASRTTKGNTYGSTSTRLEDNSKTESYQYDRYGNLTASTASGTGFGSRTTSFTYTDNLYPATTTNSKGHVSQTVYDANGRLTRTTAALKGRMTTYRYDAFGRTVSETLPGEGNTNSTDYQLGAKCPYTTAETVSCAIAESATGGKQVTLYDYAGREVRRLHQGFNGQWVSIRTTWDLNGRKVAMTRPHFVRQHNAPTVTFRYDLLNREIEKSEPASSGKQAVFITSYRGLSTDALDAKGNKHTTIANVMGYITQKSESLSASQTYTYYPDGKLHTSTDSAGNITTINYDSLGHRSKLIDPDMGTWVYRYNALGELTYKRDANNIATTIVYDSLGRKVSQKEGSVTSIWQYDGNSALGSLTRFSGRGQSTDYTYTSQGLPLEVVVTVGDERFATQYSYDGYERVTQEERPNGGAGATSERLAVQYVYNPYGYLSAVRSPRSAADSEFSAAKFRGEIKQLLDEAIALANSYLGRAEKYSQQKTFYEDKAQTLRSGILNEHQLDKASIASLAGAHKFAQWCTDTGECYLRPMGWVLIGPSPIIPVEAVIEGRAYRFDTAYYQTTSGTRLHNATLTPINPAELDAQTLIKTHDFVVKDRGNGQQSLLSSEDVYVASLDSATEQELAYTKHDLDEAAKLAASKQKHYTDLADSLITMAEQVAVLSGLYCDDAKKLGGKHSRMASYWGGCGKPNEFGQADYLQLVLDQSQLEASALSGAYLYYWQRQDTDAYDHTLAEVLGNGLVNSYQHNIATGRPEQIVTRNGSTNIRELHYRYDEHNNVTYRHDLNLGITDNWTYDAQDRVYSNTIAVADTARHGVNNPDLSRPFAFRYDKLGNITSKTGVGAYTYSKINAGPHAVTQANGLNYQYDKVGNLLRTYKEGSSVSERSLTWTEFNKPASITRNGNTVAFSYDANHNRYLKQSSDGSETFYFGKTYERIQTNDGETQHKHFVYADGKLIALNTQIR